MQTQEGEPLIRWVSRIGDEVLGQPFKYVGDTYPTVDEVREKVRDWAKEEKTTYLISYTQGKGRHTNYGIATQYNFILLG